MAGIVKIMDLPVNLTTETELTALLRSYMSIDDSMSIVYMVSVDTFKTMGEDVQLAEDIKAANLILPCEKSILTCAHVHRIKGIVNSYRYLLYMLRKPDLFKKVCVIGNDVKTTLELSELFQEQNQELDICGAYSLDAGYNDESVINDINSKEPDLLIMTVDSPGLERWVVEHRSKIYVKVCIGIGNMSDIMLKDSKKPAGWLVKLGLSDIYYDIKNRNYSVNKKKERIMKGLLADYSNKL